MTIAFASAFRKDGRCRAAVAGAALLALLASQGADAQTPPELQQLRARQALAITRIEQAAAARGPSGSPEHTAALRAGLPALGRIVDGVFDFDAAHAGVGAEPPQPIDSDPSFQKRIARRYAAARQELDTATQSTTSIGSRVIGGRRVRDPHFGSTVGIVQASLPSCTGSYLGGGRVLTAAHCVCDLELNRTGLGWHIAFGDVVPGGTHNGRVEPPLAIDPAKTSIFPAVNGADTGYCARYRPRESIMEGGLDLAILVIRDIVPNSLPVTRLGSETQLRETLSDDGDLARPFQVAGFGKSWNNGVLEVTGRKHAAYILGGEPCPASGRLGIDNAPCFAAREVSALDASGSDTCNGDSGGPLFVAGDGPQEWRLVGVTSRALRRSDRNCGGGGIYALTTSTDVMDWLRANGAPLP